MFCLYRRPRRTRIALLAPCHGVASPDRRQARQQRSREHAQPAFSKITNAPVIRVEARRLLATPDERRSKNGTVTVQAA
jgi:hypothetical protein